MGRPRPGNSGELLKDTSRRGCAWYADPNIYHVGYCVCREAHHLMEGIDLEGIDAEYLLAGKGYDRESLVEKAEEN